MRQPNDSITRAQVEMQARSIGQDKDIIVHWDTQDVTQDLSNIPDKHLREPRAEYTATILQPIQVERGHAWITTGWSLLGSTSSRPYSLTARFELIADLDENLIPVYFKFEADEEDYGAEYVG